MAGRVPGGDQPFVLLAGGDAEPIGDQREQLGARAGLAQLDEAEVPGRDADVEREVELAPSSADPPLTDQLAGGATAMYCSHRLERIGADRRHRVPHRYS